MSLSGKMQHLIWMHSFSWQKHSLYLQPCAFFTTESNNYAIRKIWLHLVGDSVIWFRCFGPGAHLNVAGRQPSGPRLEDPFPRLTTDQAAFLQVCQKNKTKKKKTTAITDIIKESLLTWPASHTALWSLWNTRFKWWVLNKNNHKLHF